MDDQRFYVYVYLDPLRPGVFEYDNYKFEYEPFYVGRGQGYRYKQHMYHYGTPRGINTIKNSKIKNILDAGLEPIIIKVVEHLTTDEANSIEIDLISKIGRIDIKTGVLSNMTSGGDMNDGFRGRHHSEETKHRISSSLLGRPSYVRNPESLKSLSNSLIEYWKTNKHPWDGRSHSEETKNKISIKNSGKLTGDKNPSKRIDVKQKIKSAYRDKKWNTKYKYFATDLETGEIIEFYSIVEFCEKYELNRSSVKVCIYDRRRHKKWKFDYCNM